MDENDEAHEPYGWNPGILHKPIEDVNILFGIYIIESIGGREECVVESPCTPDDVLTQDKPPRKNT